MTHWFNSGKICYRSNQPLSILDTRPTPRKTIHAWCCKPEQEPIPWKARALILLFLLKCVVLHHLLNIHTYIRPVQEQPSQHSSRECRDVWDPNLS